MQKYQIYDSAIHYLTIKSHISKLKAEIISVTPTKSTQDSCGIINDISPKQQFFNLNFQNGTMTNSDKGIEYATIPSLIQGSH